MSATFTPCVTCARHVKQGDARCPFCGAQAPSVTAPATRAAVGRLSRSALFAASAVGVTLATTGCSSSSPSPTPSPQPHYGGVMVPEDAASASSSGGSGDGSSTTPGDAAGETGTPEGGGSVQPLYGAVAPPRDGGSVIALYGGSPVGPT